MEVFKVFATLFLNASDFEKDLKASETRLRNAERNFTAAGRTLTFGVTAPIVGIGTAALKTAVEFESAFAGVRKTVDATEEEFAMLERGIRAMSARMPASADQIARVAEAAGQLGIETENILGFTEVMIGLGEATADLNADEAAMALARFANIMQMPQSQVDRLASSVVHLGNNLAATEGEIVRMSLRIAGAGNVIGLTEAEVMGVSGALASLGIRAEMGGSAISRVMLTMMSAVMGGTDSLGGLAAQAGLTDDEIAELGEDVAVSAGALGQFADVAGMTADEFATAFRERPTEAIAAFTAGLGRIVDAGGDVTTVLGDLSLNEIRVRDALLRMAGSGDVLTNSVELSTQAWEENIALQTEVDRRYETTESQMAMVRNQAMEVARTLGDALIPFVLALLEAAKPLIGALQGLAEWFGNLDPAMQTFVVGGAAVVAAIGPILWMIGSFQGAVANLLPILKLVPGAFAAIRAAIGFLTGPIGWIITAVGLIAAAWSTDFLGLKTMALEAWENIKGRFSEAWERLQYFGGEIRNVVIGLVDEFRAFLDRIRQVSADIEAAFREWWGAIWTYLSGLPAQMLQFGKDLMQGLVNGVSSMVTAAVDSVKGVGQNVIDGFKNLLGIQSPSTVFYGFGLDIGEGLAQGIEASQARVDKAVGGFAGGMQRVLSGAFDADAMAAALTNGLDSDAARAAIRDKLAALEQQRADLLYNQARGGRLARVAMPMVDRQIEALQEELRRLRQELVVSRNASSRDSEIQTRRFTLAVDTFDNGVRGMTLAAQRY